MVATTSDLQNIFVKFSFDTLIHRQFERCSSASQVVIHRSKLFDVSKQMALNNVNNISEQEEKSIGT